MRLEDIGFYTLSDERARTSSPTSRMQRCEMIVTGRCNFRCPYCRGDRGKTDIEPEDARRCIDHWCSGQPLKNIRFSGGEPTLHPYLGEMVTYAQDSGVGRIAISTNGSADAGLYRELVAAGCSDFSVSLDACCASVGDKMAGGINGSWRKVVGNIELLSGLAYTTVGIVLTPDNVRDAVRSITFAHSLGVADIRIISAAQWNRPIPGLGHVPDQVLAAHPILRYRVRNLANGRGVRGLRSVDSRRCRLAMDDSVVSGEAHYPCIIYMREGGAAIGAVSSRMREERVRWALSHDTHKDPICRKSCLDVCIDYNNAAARFGVREGLEAA